MDKQIMELLQRMDSRMERIEGEVKGIRTTQEEHGQILRALDERTQVLSAKAENTEHELAEIKGEITGLRSDLNLVELATAKNWTEIVKLKSVK